MPFVRKDIVSRRRIEPIFLIMSQQFGMLCEYKTFNRFLHSNLFSIGCFEVDQPLVHEFEILISLLWWIGRELMMSWATAQHSFTMLFYRMFKIMASWSLTLYRSTPKADSSETTKECIDYGVRCCWKWLMFYLLSNSQKGWVHSWKSKPWQSLVVKL